MQVHPANPVETAAGATSMPLFHAAWLFAAGIVVANSFWLRPSLLLIALAIAATLCGAAALSAQRVVAAGVVVAHAWRVVRGDGTASCART
jgi:hypothetical protein